MPADTATAIAALGAQHVENSASVAVIRKIQDQQQLQGQAAIKLIEAAGPQMIKTPDGHISVRA